MKFKALAGFFECLEGTSSRNKMIEILAELYNESEVEEIGRISYFLCGEITAGYRDVKLGMGEEMVKKSIALSSDVDEDEVEKRLKRLGDLGDVASELFRGKKGRSEKVFDFHDDLSVEAVHEGLMKIADASGPSSQEVKVKTLAAILAGEGAEARRYIVRSAVGQMRLGVGEMTILDGLAAAYLGSKNERPPLEHAYNVCSDIGYVAQILAESGLDGIKSIRISLNRPIRPMLAQRVDQMSEIMEKIGSEDISVEEKFDGERIQAHKDGDEVKLFSRRLNDVTVQFPEIIDNVRKHVKAEKAILDGEAVAFNFEEGEYYPFQKIMRRRRKYRVEEYAEEIPVRYVLFDILYLNGGSLMRKGYPERVKHLEGTVEEHEYIAITDRIVSSELEEIDEFFQDCIERGLEGIVCKSCAEDSYYRAGAREWSWIKWKPSYASEMSDTLDLVVVGAYAGKGKRGGRYGALLCASYDHEGDVFQTVCKLGTGFTDEQLETLPDKLKDAATEGNPPRVQVNSNLEPDYWFVPQYVLEVRGSEITESPVHTCCWDEGEGRGLALRFPRFEKWRPEKSEEQATTAKEIRSISKIGFGEDY